MSTSLPTSSAVFTPEAAASLPGVQWLSERRTAAAERFAASALPSDKEEIWRYSRIGQLDVERYAPVGAGSGSDVRGAALSGRVHALADRFGSRAALVVTFDGVLATVVADGTSAGLAVGRLSDRPDGIDLLGTTVADPEDFVVMNDAFAVDPLLIDVADGSVVDGPVIVAHVMTGAARAAVFPRTIVRAGVGSRVSVVELSVDLDEGPLTVHQADRLTPAEPVERLIVPVTELSLGREATVDYVSIQAVGSATWQVAHQSAVLSQGASLSSYAVALGGAYARVRTDTRLAGEGASSRLRAAFVGRGDQMLDFRTLQDHAAPRTTSDLLFMGAVAEQAHSVYSGVIRIRPGAVRSDARQTNHNMVLDEGAHADSVPNLEIEENDVQCSHGSTVGPVDEDQRYYLESRGVTPERAEELIVGGFFASIADQVPVAGAKAVVAAALADRSRVVRD